MNNHLNFYGALVGEGLIGDIGTRGGGYSFARVRIQQRDKGDYIASINAAQSRRCCPRECLAHGCNPRVLRRQTVRVYGPDLAIIYDRLMEACGDLPDGWRRDARSAARTAHAKASIR